MLAAKPRDEDAYVASLEAENERLQDRVDQLEEAFGLRVRLTPPEWGLTGKERRLLGILLARELMTKSAAMTGLYEPGADDEPQMKIIDVFICKLRKKLKPFEIEIETVWGEGYRMSAAMKARAQAMMAGEAVQ